MTIINEVREAIWKLDTKEFFSADIKLPCGYTLSRKQKAIYHLVESGELTKIKVKGKGYNFIYRVTKDLKPSNYQGQLGGRKAKDKNDPLAGWMSVFPQYFTPPEFKVIGQKVVRHPI